MNNLLNSIYLFLHILNRLFFLGSDSLSLKIIVVILIFLVRMRIIVVIRWRRPMNFWIFLSLENIFKLKVVINVLVGLLWTPHSLSSLWWIYIRQDSLAITIPYLIFLRLCSWLSLKVIWIAFNRNRGVLLLLLLTSHHLLWAFATGSFL